MIKILIIFLRFIIILFVPIYLTLGLILFCLMPIQFAFEFAIRGKIDYGFKILDDVFEEIPTRIINLINQIDKQ